MTSSPPWLGIDVGGTLIKWEVVSDDGSSLTSGTTPTPTSGHTDVTEAIATIIEKAAAGPDGLAGVGVAVPGHLADDRDSITLLPNVAGDWTGYPVRSLLHSTTGFEPVLLNDARAFALAELELGAARGELDVVFSTIGTGIGGAVAVGGTVVSSRRDSFGEIGHTTAVADGEQCSCGGRGCVEAFAGGASVLRRATERGISIAVGPHALAALGRMATTDAGVAAVLDEAYDAFAIGLSTVCAFAGARVAVVGGTVAAELPGYLDRGRARLDQRRGLLGPVDVRAAMLGSRAGALGAALAARSEYSRSERELEYRP